MNYKEYRENIKELTLIKEDDLFIQYEILYNSSNLMEDSHKFIQNGKLSFAYPVMRQVYEYIIILLAFNYRLATIYDFAKVKTDDSFISVLKGKIWIKVIEDSGKTKGIIFKDFMRGLWKSLCERTHANFDRLLLQAYEYDTLLGKNEQLKNEAEIIHRLLDALFWICADFLMGKKTDKKDYGLLKGKKPNFEKKILYPKSNNGIVERILEIEHIQTVFSRRFIQLRDGYIEIKPHLEEY